MIARRTGFHRNRGIRMATEDPPRCSTMPWQKCYQPVPGSGGRPHIILCERTTTDMHTASNDLRVSCWLTAQLACVVFNADQCFIPLRVPPVAA